jgi:ABC-2 type transport system ATP-binding protein
VTAPGAPAVSCRGLTKRYGAILALDRLDLEVPAGSVFGFLGPNGAGKTTTLRLLTGLARPTSGVATVAGLPVGSGDGEMARHIGYLDQDPRFHGWMKGREVLEFVGRLYGIEGRALRARVAEVLGIVGLADAGDRAAGGYSGGMRQRLGLGQAIIARPSVLFLDEPVSSLDPEGRRDVLEIISAVRQTATVFMSTHILNDVERVCDRVGVLDHGRLVTVAPIDELLERYARPVFRLDPEPGQEAAVASFAASLRGQAWALDVHVDHGYMRVLVSDPAAAGSEILERMSGSGIRFAGFERMRPSLEDVFLQLVGADHEADPGAGARL